MTHRFFLRSRRALLALPAPLALLALSAAALLTVLSQPADVTPLAAARPAVYLSGAAPGQPSLQQEAGRLPAAHVADVAALVAAQRRKGLDCGVTSRSLPVCTHGGDHHLRDAPRLVMPAGGPSGSTTGTRLGCYGNGRDGLRVQAVYARSAGSADRFGTVLPHLRRIAAGVDATFDAAARSTNGRRHVRFAATASCELDVARVVLGNSAFTSMKAMVDALQVEGFGQSARSYLVWADTSVLCGMATMYVDDSPKLDNLNNGALPSYARVDRPCWGKAEVHELVHAFGGVQPSAPHSTGGYHCSDGSDVMCYDDGSARSTQRAVCAKSSTPVLDCRHDDYFSTAAPRGSYLQTRWNVARSSFLTPSWDEPAPAPAGSPSPRPEPTGPAANTPPDTHATPTPSTSPSDKASPSPSPSASASPLLGVPALPPLPSGVPTLTATLTPVLATRQHAAAAVAAVAVLARGRRS